LIIFFPFWGTLVIIIISIMGLIPVIGRKVYTSFKTYFKIMDNMKSKSKNV